MKQDKFYINRKLIIFCRLLGTRSPWLCESNKTAAERKNGESQSRAEFYPKAVALDGVRQMFTIVVWRLDRLSRSLKDLISEGFIPRSLLRK